MTSRCLYQGRQLNNRVNKTSRQGNASSTFDSKSLVSQRAALSNERKREEISLNILTRRALNKLGDHDSAPRIRLKSHLAASAFGRADTKDQSRIRDVQKDRTVDQDSESSSLIRQNVKRTMYSTFADMKERQISKNRLTEMQR